MGLVDIVKKGSEPIVDLNKLSPQELQLVLELLKQSSIKGEQVELFYGLVVKLQNQFIEQTKK